LGQPLLKFLGSSSSTGVILIKWLARRGLVGVTWA
jgi:hypothetical protein